MMRRVVAIDGPAGAGKSTVARIVASRLGLVHIDTGATYRLVGLRALEERVPLDDPAALARLSREVADECDLGPRGELRYRGGLVGPEIRAPEVGDAASRVARHPDVRRELVALQRRLVPPEGAVIEGRDIGTIVWPEARVKAYLDAREDTRIARRAREIRGARPEALVSDVPERDERDASRPVGSMRPAPDAMLIDTTDLSAGEVAARIMGRLGTDRPNLMYRVVRGVLRFVLRSAFRLEVVGGDRIPSAGPAILAANHRSLIDIPVLAAVTPRKVWFMGKEELFRSRPMRRIFTALGGFAVRRGKPDRRALNTALELLRDGQLVGVYPEGTRRPQARFGEVEDGLAYLALRSGAPIVPVAITGTESVFPPGRRMPKRVRIRALVGESFSLGGPVEGMVPRSRVREATGEARVRLSAVIGELEARP